MSTNFRRKLLARDGYNDAEGKTKIRCRYCTAVLAPQHMIAEHATPLARGGLDQLANIVASCNSCDKLKGPLTAAEFLELRDDHAARKSRIRFLAEGLVRRRQAEAGSPHRQQRRRR